MNIPLDDIINMKMLMDDMDVPMEDKHVHFYDDDDVAFSMSYHEVVEYIKVRTH